MGSFVLLWVLFSAHLVTAFRPTSPSLRQWARETRGGTPPRRWQHDDPSRAPVTTCRLHLHDEPPAPATAAVRAKAVAAAAAAAAIVCAGWLSPALVVLLPAAPVHAKATNPDAIDVRRVAQQPEVAAAPDVPRTVVKLPSGVQYFDYVVGTGPETVEEGKTVQFQWVLRRSNGYFVDASSNYGDEPFIYKVGNTKKVIRGIDEAIRGMKVGGIRRMNIPPELAFVEGVGDGKPGPMPQGFGPQRQILTRIDKEVWYFEIKVVKVK